MNQSTIHELTQRLQQLEMDSEQRQALDKLRDVAIAENKRRIENRKRRPVNCPPCSTSAFRYGEYAGLLTAGVCALCFFVASNSGIVINNRPIITLTAMLISTTAVTIAVTLYRSWQNRPDTDVIRAPDTTQPKRDTTIPQPERVTLYTYRRAGRDYQINVLRSDLKFLVDIYEENHGRMPTFSKSTWKLGASAYKQLRKVGAAKGHFILGTGNKQNTLKPAGIAHFATILDRDYRTFPTAPDSAEYDQPFRSRSVLPTGTHENSTEDDSGGEATEQHVMTTLETAGEVFANMIVEGV